MLTFQCHFNGPTEAIGLPEANGPPKVHGPRGHYPPSLSTALIVDYVRVFIIACFCFLNFRVYGISKIIF